MATLVNPIPDGGSSLLVGDGSPAQVGVLTNQLIATEKSNVVETFNLLSNGAVSGRATLVSDIPSDANEAVSANEPFGLATWGNNAYVTIAHDNEIALVRNDGIINHTIGTQNAPSWATLMGPFLYTNTASQNLSWYAVYGQKIVLDAPIVATFTGNPTDNTSGEGIVAAIDSGNGNSHLSIFTSDGNLKTSAVASQCRHQRRGGGTQIRVTEVFTSSNGESLTDGPAPSLGRLFVSRGSYRVRRPVPAH